MRQIFILTLAILISLTPLAPASAYELTGLDLETVVRVDSLPDAFHPADQYFYNPGNFEPADQVIQYGTGFFIDYRGCLLTNAHVVTDFDDSRFKNLQIRLSTDLALKPQPAYPADVLFYDQGIDLAVLCVNDPERNFHHFYDIADDSRIDLLKIKDDISILGYPDIGGDSITYSTGKITGFWKEADLNYFLGENYFEDKRLEVIKSDTITGPGGSGSPVFDDDGNVIGMIFAAAFVPSGINFIISGKVLNDWYDLYINTASPSTSCLRDTEKNLFRKEGVYYYDNFCIVQQNLNIENAVQLNYQERCGANLDDRRLKMAAYHIATGSTINKWWDYLGKFCPVNQQTAVEQSSFAYAQTRAPLVVEQTKAIELKNGLEKSVGQLNLSSDNWYKLVNAYIYGGYPIEAISQAVKLGGYTVHPEIPFGAWKSSQDYIKNIIK